MEKFKLFNKIKRCFLVPAYRGALLRHGVIAAAEHEKILNGRKFTTVVDIGANVGQFALVARQCFPDARIFSFEPLPAPAARFRAVFASDKQTVLHQAAVCPESGEATIHVSRRDDSSSLLPITALQNEIFPGTAQALTAIIRTEPLREVIARDQIVAPALLKLDVQGFELQALKGCEDLLGSFACVYVECSFQELYRGQAFAGEVIAWLREKGFSIRGVYNTSYDRYARAVQADFLFESTDVN